MWSPLNFFHKKKENSEENGQVDGRRPLRFAERKDRQRRRMGIIRSLLLVLGLFLLFSLTRNIWSHFFIRDITCRLEDSVCDENLQTLSKSLLGKSIFSDLHFSHSYLQVSLKREWPDRVSVFFTKPELLVTFQPSQEGEQAYSLTKQGVLVSFTGANQHLPPIYDHRLEKMSVSASVDEKTRSFYTYITSKIPGDVTSHIKKITVVSEDEVVIELDMNTLAIADTTRIDSQLLSLQALLSSPTIDRNGKTVDLRFDNPVLK